jgi:hypothetical protein
MITAGTSRTFSAASTVAFAVGPIIRVCTVDRYVVAEWCPLVVQFGRRLLAELPT